MLSRLKIGSLVITLLGMLLMSACSSQRDIPEGKVMLNRVSVVADGKYKDINTAQLKSYVRQMWIFAGCAVLFVGYIMVHRKIMGSKKKAPETSESNEKPEEKEA